MFQITKTIMLTIFFMAIHSQAHAFGVKFKNSQNNELISKGEIEVTIENLTQNQVMSPVVLRTSGPAYGYSSGVKESFRLFKLGVPSSEELELVAEDGDTSGFEVNEFQQIGPGPILPGATQSIKIALPDTRFGASLSLISMLVNTNDAFVGLDFFRLENTSGFGSVLHELEVNDELVTYARVYDAGTEFNSESCEHIPGPVCGSPNARPERAGEGNVQVHPGLNLRGDLTPDLVFSSLAGAKVTVRRLN